MGAMKINRAEKDLLAHLAEGGSPSDATGKRHIQRFAATVAEDKSTKPILSRHGISEEEVAELYREVLEALMPEPWMKSGGPMLVPTQWFMEPHRLDELLQTSGDFEDLTDRAILLAQETKAAHDMQHGKPDPDRLKRIAAGGGCASVILVGIALHGLFAFL